MKIKCEKESVTARYILQDFFLAKAMLGEYLDAMSFLRALGEAYGLSAECTECLYDAAAADTQISCAEDYHKLLRAVQYMETMAQGKDRDAICSVLYRDDLRVKTVASLHLRIEDVRRIKGRAYEFAEENKTACRKGADEADICRTLCAPKASRLIPVMRICGIMMCEGLFFEKDMEEGMSRLRACAGWNDVASLLPLMKYEAAEEGCSAEIRLYEDFCMLRAIAENSTEEPFVQAARDMYGTVLAEYEWIGTNAGDNAQVLRQVFAANERLHEDRYDPLYASVLSAENLSLKDKEKLLMGADSNRAQVMCLPLQQHVRDADFNGEDFVEAAPYWMQSQLEDKETEILCSHSYVCLGDYAADLMMSIMDLDWRLTCICANSKYVRNAYIKAIEAGFDDKCANVMHVDISGRSPQDMACFSGSVFFRSYDPHRVNVCIVEASGDIPEATLRAAAWYLNPKYRNECCIQDLGITLDLTEGPVICVVDGEAMEKFRTVLHAEAWTVEEHSLLRMQILNGILRTRQEELDMEELDMDEGAKKLLLSVPLDKAVEALEKTIRAGKGKEKMHITEDMIRIDRKDAEAGTVGFLRRQI
ncbi:MAG: hypothetical protein LUD51_00240 [Clostridia bacterium]|nr:hypothetical protein [Clostridia bacterium]